MSKLYKINLLLINRRYSSNNAKVLAREIAKDGNILEILVTTKLINNLIKLLDEITNVKVVIGHFGLPESVGDDFEYWENIISIESLAL